MLSPDGKTAYVANTATGDFKSFAPDGVVSTIDVATHRAGRAFTVPGVPQAVALTPDGRTLYEVGMEHFGRSALAAVDVATGKVTGAIQLPYNLGAVAIAPAPSGFCG